MSDQGQRPYVPAHLVVLVLDDVSYSDEVLSAWEDAGAPGVTMIGSTGLKREQGAVRDDMPLFPSLRDFLDHRELYHRTLFSVVTDEALIDRIVEATESVIGSLDEPYNGILFVTPVARAYGLRARDPAS